MSVIVNNKPETDLRTSDFFYDLPGERIAQHPMTPRDHSRLMVLDREQHTVTHRHFYDILEYLKPGDVLVNLEKMHASLNEMREAYGYDRIEEAWADQPLLPMGLTFGNEFADLDIDENA